MVLAIDVRQITKIYDGKIRALDGVDLEVNAADVFALLGPNGSGKTTLMRILTTQFRPTSGEAYSFGIDIIRNDAWVRKMIGYVPQETSVWTDISGFENLLIYSKIYGVPSSRRKKSISDALQIMGLEEMADGLVKKYSGGMVRRLEIACALLVKPKILFLDEPTIGLDPSARKAVWENLIFFKNEYGTTIFFNTHYMDEADLYSDHIAIIKRGKIVKSGTVNDLKHSLHSEVLLLDLKSHALDETALTDIRALDCVRDVVVSDSELRVFIDDADTALPKIMETLWRKGISIKKITTTRPTLDDVFLNYAGSITAVRKHSPQNAKGAPAWD
ncbi:Molybdate/tungstate import ATP-binding protein WtpC [uncultured archaeon]|nr:Molybdate/tungstate import ATP-binding protein WtpC [uncultured archaeon]